jgi:hypothetical protein
MIGPQVVLAAKLVLALVVQAEVLVSDWEESQVPLQVGKAQVHVPQGSHQP